MPAREDEESAMKIDVNTTAEDIFAAMVEQWDALVAEESDGFAAVGEHYGLRECIEMDEDYDPEVDGKCWHHEAEKELDALASVSDQIARMLTASAHRMPLELIATAPRTVQVNAMW